MRVRRLLLCLGFMSCLLLPSLPASGISYDNMVLTGSGTTYCAKGAYNNLHYVCQTDNNYWTLWIQGSVSTTGSDRIHSVLADQFGPTDLSLHYVSSPSYSGSAETDAIFQQRTDIASNLDVVPTEVRQG